VPDSIWDLRRVGGVARRLTEEYQHKSKLEHSNNIFHHGMIIIVRETTAYEAAEALRADSTKLRHEG
jgi:hypothetical protein